MRTLNWLKAYTGLHDHSCRAVCKGYSDEARQRGGESPIHAVMLREESPFSIRSQRGIIDCILLPDTCDRCSRELRDLALIVIESITYC